MRSMTGFGAGSTAVQGVELRCELRSVNHRGLDIKVRLPRELAGLEVLVMTRIRKVLERGRVDVGFTMTHASPGRVAFEERAATAVVDAALAFARSRGDVEPRITAGDLLRVHGLVAAADGELTPADAEVPLLAALDEAVVDLTRSRHEEGRGLERDLQARLATCRQIVAALRERTGGSPERLASSLKTRLAGLTRDVDPGRLAQEIALLAERADVTEELTRLELHIDHFELLCRHGEGLGRKLDFLCQELLREANTTASKCGDATAAHHVINLKAEIERVREQVQNVE